MVDNIAVDAGAQGEFAKHVTHIITGKWHAENVSAESPCLRTPLSPH
jgi:hypothetical protein